MPRQPAVLPPDRDACVCTLLRGIARKASAIYEEHLDGSGLTHAQFSLLARLDRLGSSSLSALANALDLDVTSTSRSVKLVVAAGLVDVSPGPDARTKAYRLSREGRRRLKQAYPAWQASQAAIKRLVSPQQRAELERVAAALAKPTATR
jgi:DNA-binding MarR family transcriptional regulator